MAKRTPRIATGMFEASIAISTVGNCTARGEVAHSLVKGMIEHTYHISTSSPGLYDNYGNRPRGKSEKRGARMTYQPQMCRVYSTALV